VPNVNMLACEGDPVEKIIAIAKREVYPTRWPPTLSMDIG
jgi:hypothetical protein